MLASVPFLPLLRLFDAIHVTDGFYSPLNCAFIECLHKMPALSQRGPLSLGKDETTLPHLVRQRYRSLCLTG